MNNDKMLCPRCGAKTEIRKIIETFEIRNQPITNESTVLFCPNCNIALFDEELDSQNIKAAYSKYRKIHKFLSPEEIKKIRTKCGLSQIAFSQLCGFKDLRIRNIERGSLQSHEEDLIIRTCFPH